MTNYLETISVIMGQAETMLIVLISIYLVAASVDYILGTVIVYLTRKESYNSKIAQLGIVRKLATLILMIIIVPIAMIMPIDIGTYSLIVLYVGIVVSEIYSILGHVGIVEDGNKGANLIGKLFENILGAANKKD